jgi:hypothetical protein
MATRLVTSDYGVDAGLHDRSRTRQAPKCVSRGDKEEPHGENREDHREAEYEYEEKRKRKAVRGMSLWMLASRTLYLRVFIRLADYEGDFSHTGGMPVSDYQI